jgi:NAD(P)-dependent dehydrogenase (short-subunit alcohol dehydrogenase family)
VTSLAGRVALVTGASRGTGVNIARALASAGARIAVHYRTDRAAAAALAASLRDRGAGAEIFGADVARSDEVRRLVAEVQARLGPPRGGGQQRRSVQRHAVR